MVVLMYCVCLLYLFKNSLCYHITSKKNKKNNLSFSFYFYSSSPLKNVKEKIGLVMIKQSQTILLFCCRVKSLLLNHHIRCIHQRSHSKNNNTVLIIKYCYILLNPLYMMSPTPPYFGLRSASCTRQ